MSRKPEIVDIEGELVRPFETERAWRFSNGSTEAWLAKSLADWDERDKVMTLPMWLAEQEGLI